MNVLFVASECAPFVKTGGLADVIGSMPKALSKAGVNVKVLVPAYPALKNLAAKAEKVFQLDRLFADKAEIKAIKSDGIDLLLLDAPHHFDRTGGIYLDPDGKDWPDNPMRFAALSFAGAKISSNGINGWKPDVVNIHDWQAGLVPAYLGKHRQSAPPVVMTIHNIAFQGLAAAEMLSRLKLDRKLFNPEGVEYYGKISFLKAGVALSDRITTVSPSYASELLTPEFGMGFDGLLQARRNVLSGILNGIDLDIWNPETDPDLVRTYSSRSLRRKDANRREVEIRFGLKKSDGPLFCVVSRLTSQKGVDMVLDCLPRLVGEGASLALLGSGSVELEQQFVAAANRHAGNVGVIIGYDERLSHLMQGGCDSILVPSRFEPCGLTQLYGLRYGTLPVVARTGGLTDTVIDANEAAVTANCATGFQFAPINATMLGQAISRACAIYRQPDVWSAMMRRAMRCPVGWSASAAAYHEIYSSLMAD